MLGWIYDELIRDKPVCKHNRRTDKEVLKLEQTAVPDSNGRVQLELAKGRDKAIKWIEVILSLFDCSTNWVYLVAFTMGINELATIRHIFIVFQIISTFLVTFECLAGLYLCCERIIKQNNSKCSKFLNWWIDSVMETGFSIRYVTLINDVIIPLQYWIATSESCLGQLEHDLMFDERSLELRLVFYFFGLATLINLGFQILCFVYNKKKNKILQSHCRCSCSHRMRLHKRVRTHDLCVTFYMFLLVVAFFHLLLENAHYSLSFYMKKDSQAFTLSTTLSIDMPFQFQEAIYAGYPDEDPMIQIGKIDGDKFKLFETINFQKLWKIRDGSFTHRTINRTLKLDDFILSDNLGTFRLRYPCSQLLNNNLSISKQLGGFTPAVGNCSLLFEFSGTFSKLIGSKYSNLYYDSGYNITVSKLQLEVLESTEECTCLPLSLNIPENKKYDRNNNLVDIHETTLLASIDIPTSRKNVAELLKTLYTDKCKQINSFPVIGCSNDGAVGITLHCNSAPFVPNKTVFDRIIRASESLLTDPQPVPNLPPIIYYSLSDLCTFFDGEICNGRLEDGTVCELRLNSSLTSNDQWSKKVFGDFNLATLNCHTTMGEPVIGTEYEDTDDVCLGKVVYQPFLAEINFSVKYDNCLPFILNPPPYIETCSC